MNIIMMAFRPLGPRWFTLAAESSEEGWLQRCAGFIHDLASNRYTRSLLQDSRLFGPSPWKILATTYEQKDS